MAEVKVFNAIFEKDHDEIEHYFYNLAAKVKSGHNIPFEDIIYVAEVLETELLNLIEHKILNKEIKYVIKRFELIKQSIAKSYFTLIMKDIISFFYANKSDEKHLSSSSVHREWFEGFALFIKDAKKIKPLL